MAGLIPPPFKTQDEKTQKLEYRGKQKKSWVDKPVSIPLILSLAMPSVVEQIVQLVVGITDTMVAGRTGDTEDMHAAAEAAVGCVTYLQWFAGLMAGGLAIGAMVIVSRSIGGRKFRVANQVAGTAVSAAFLIGLAVAVLFYLAARPMVGLFGLKDQAAEFAVEYMSIMSWTICFQTAGQIGMACLRGAGDTVRPLIVTIAIALVNGVAAPALAFGWFGLPKWGVAGNATGTLLAFAAAGVVTMGFLFWGDGGLKLMLAHLRIAPHLLRRVMKLGLPSWVEGMLLWGGQMGVVMLVMRVVDAAVDRAGSGTTMAAHIAVLRLESLAYLPGYGFGIACSALVGQYLGAGKPSEAERTAILCNRITILTMVVAALPMIVLAKPLLWLIVESAKVVDLGFWPLILAGLAQPGFAVAIVKSSALKGAGDTVSPMIATMTGMGGRVLVVLAAMPVLAHIGHPEWGLNVVWVCIFLDLGYRGLYLAMVFRRGLWKTLRV